MAYRNRTVGTKENPRHILGLSGGKDSTALAIYMKQNKPEIFEKIELFFTDTGTELPELYDYLEKLQDYLGKEITFLKASPESKRGFKKTTLEDESIPFNDILDKYNGFLPSANARYCTRELKISPMEKWARKDYCVSYVGIRADEKARLGYRQKEYTAKITAEYPFKEAGYDVKDIYNLLEETVGIPPYYKWRTRSGCYFCFYQRQVEWAVMYYLYPELFKKAKEYEDDKFTWSQQHSLDYVEENAKDMIQRYIRRQYTKSTDDYRKGFVNTLPQMLQLIEEEKIREFVDSWDLKRLHDVDGDFLDRDGCMVCAL